MNNSPAKRGRVASFFAPKLTQRQKMTWRWNALGVALIAVVVTAAGAATGPADTPSQAAAGQPTNAAMPVRTAVATPVDSFLRERVYTGTLVARRKSTLSFERAGKLLELSVDEGDRVTKGQVLASLDTRRLTARKSRAEAELGQSMARLRELVAGPRRQTIAAARAEVRSLSAQRDVAELKLRRRETLVKTNAVSREEYDEALYEYRAAAARTDVGQKTLDELEAGTRDEQIEAQRALVGSVEAALADIIHELDDSVLVAPFDGQITQRRIDEGTVVGAGAAVFDLIETDVLEAWIGVPPRSTRVLKTGEAINVTIAGRGYEATIQSVRRELDPETRTQNVVLLIDQPEGLVAGEIARVGVREPVMTTGYWVPTGSLTPDRRGLWSVLVAEEGFAAARPVEVIENDGDRSFVRGALQPGERVIVEGSHRVAPGQAVAAQPEPTGVAR